MKQIIEKEGKRDSDLPVDQEFMDFLTDPESLRILKSAARALLPSWGIVDPEDIISDIFQKYGKEGAARPPVLNRNTLFTLARRQVLDCVRKQKTTKRGGGFEHVSINQGDFSQSLLTSFDAPTCSLGNSPKAAEILRALYRLSALKSGKQLAAIGAMIRWIEKGCPGDDWFEELSPEEVEGFMALSKGKSLRGKASATVTKVRNSLKEILGKEGLLRN